MARAAGVGEVLGGVPGRSEAGRAARRDRADRSSSPPPAGSSPARAGRRSCRPWSPGWGRGCWCARAPNPARHRGLLAGLGLPAAVFTVAGEPTVELARAAVAAAREHGADVVAAIGGGSVIDARARRPPCCWATAATRWTTWRSSASGRPITRPSVPCVAVPTTAGTGAEVTANAVLASPEHGLKASLRSPLMLPRVALVDPLLTVSLPAGGHRGQRAGRAHPVPGAVRLAPGHPAHRRAGPRGAAPRGGGPARRLRRRRRPRRRGRTWPCAACSAGWRWPTRSSARCTASPASSAGSRTCRTAGLRGAAGPGHRGERARAAVRAPGAPRPGPVRRGRPAADRRSRRVRRGRPGLDPPDAHPARRSRAGRVRHRAASTPTTSPPKAARSSSMQGNPVALTHGDLRAIVPPGTLTAAAGLRCGAGGPGAAGGGRRRGARRCAVAEPAPPRHTLSRRVLRLRG